MTTLKGNVTYRYDSESDMDIVIGVVSKWIFKPKGIMGAITTNARRKHTITLMKLHRGLIILGLGNSRKSAPLIPKLSETIPREKTNRMASVKPIPAIHGEGAIKRTLVKKQTSVTAKLKRVAKKYFAFTRPRTDMGDE